MAAAATRSVNAISGNRSCSTLLTGATGEYLEVFGWLLAAGRTFTESEERAGRTLCLVGTTVERELFGAREPVGSRIRLGKLSCEIVGLLAAKATPPSARTGTTRCWCRSACSIAGWPATTTSGPAFATPHSLGSYYRARRPTGG